MKFSSPQSNIAQALVTQLIKSLIANRLPNNYSILELGSNVGQLAYEVHMRMPEKFYFLGIEPSKKMIARQKRNNNELINKSYDSIIHSPIKRFLAKKHKTKYNIIFSLDTISYDKNLKNVLIKILNLLLPEGFFRFVFKPHLHQKRCSFLEIKYNLFFYIQI